MISFNGEYVLYAGKCIGRLCNRITDVQSKSWFELNPATLIFLGGCLIFFVIGVGGIYVDLKKRNSENTKEKFR